MRLDETAIGRLPPAFHRPAYDRRNARPGVVHLGVGAFFRAHQALVFDRALEAGDMRWGIAGVSLRSPEMHTRLAPQNGLYTLTERNGEGESHRVIGALRSIEVAPERPGRIVDVLAGAETHVVTLTVTEKGYLLDPATGLLDLAHPDVAHDTASPHDPRTAIGLIVAGLARRRSAGLSPFTAISCDNLSHNGKRLRDAVLAVAGTTDPGLCEWIDRHGAFPETMVDRIVPAITEDDIRDLERETGVLDLGLVKTEAYFQWVIESRFAGAVPEFDRYGADVVDDVTPFETAKLRLLNGAHSAIAYLGGLAGIDFVHDFVAREDGRRFVEALWRESGETLTPISGLDIAGYRRQLMTRFANSALAHRTRQIAMDGSQKLPQRLLAPLAWRAERGLSIKALSLAIAAWMRWLDGRDDDGRLHDIQDPLATLLQGSDDMPACEEVDRLLAFRTIFPASIARDTHIRDALVEALTILREQGAAGCLRNY